MDIARYLERIGFLETPWVNDDTFFSLHRQHILNVPFENLDIHFKKLFTLEKDKIYNKVVENNRGGFCYELNYIFNELLNRIGFTSRIISARILNDDIPGPEYDHMLLLVQTDKQFIADVGYGDLFMHPLELKENTIQSDGRNYFKIEKYDGEDYVVSMSADMELFQKKYTFKLSACSTSDFLGICYDKQTNPDSYFVKNTICTKATPAGRVTLFNDKLIEKINDEKREITIKDDDDLKNCLKQRFQIVIN
jgi:N-hydroxyarylamine O-acetyltransferase